MSSATSCGQVITHFITSVGDIAISVNHILAKLVIFDGWFKHKAHSITSHAEDAEDVLQTVAEKLLRNQQPCNQSYAAKAVSSTAIDLLRGQQRRAVHEDCNTEIDVDIATDFGTSCPEKLVQVDQATNAFQEAMSELSPLCQEVMLRYYLEGESQKSIALSLDVHLSTIEKQLAKGRKHCFARVKTCI